MRDPYEILGLPQTATTDDINRTFRRLAKELHPDANSNDPESVTRFTELNHAYEILGDRNKRAAFDRGEIDTTGAPVPQTSLQLRLRRPTSAARRIVPCLILGSILGAGAVLLIQSQMQPTQVNTSSVSKTDALPELRTHEQRQAPPQPQPAPEAQTEQNAARKAEPEPPRNTSHSVARLVVQQTVLSTSVDGIPLGVDVIGADIGLALEISGLAGGVTLSTGRPLGAGRWRILTTDLPNALILAPADFRGAIDVDVELRGSDDAVIDRRSLHRLGPAQVALLIKRSRELISEGDVAAARPSLQRAAEARDAHAALALGATYDPIMLSTLQAHGLAADVALARGWYERATELGSQEAQQRLDLLAALGR